jgi:hypothetical protein
MLGFSTFLVTSRAIVTSKHDDDIDDDIDDDDD